MTNHKSFIPLTPDSSNITALALSEDGQVNFVITVYNGATSFSQLAFYQLDILSTWQLVNLPFCHILICNIWHCVFLSTRHFANLSSCLFVNQTSWKLVIWSICQFVSLTFRQPANLSTCHFAIFHLAIFVIVSFCQLDVLPTCHLINLPICQLDILSTCQFVNYETENLMYLTVHYKLRSYRFALQARSYIVYHQNLIPLLSLKFICFVNIRGFRGRIFSRVWPFYEQAVSDLDRSMDRSLWV